jgi:hypothetical protein
MAIPPFVCWVDGTKKAADLLKTDGWLKLLMM